jgi:hypothetical protein
MTLTYHRLANPVTQDLAIAKMQIRSGEIWGYEHRGGLFPSVKAYRGPLAKQEGVQFETGIQPDKFTPNNLAIWRLPQQGGAPEVEERKRIRDAIAACIKVRIVFTRYRCRRLGA